MSWAQPYFSSFALLWQVRTSQTQVNASPHFAKPANASPHFANPTNASLLLAKVGDTQVRTSNTDFPHSSALPPKPLTQVFYGF